MQTPESVTEAAIAHAIDHYPKIYHHLIDSLTHSINVVKFPYSALDEYPHRTPFYIEVIQLICQGYGWTVEVINTREYIILDARFYSVEVIERIRKERLERVRESSQPTQLF